MSLGLPALSRGPNSIAGQAAPAPADGARSRPRALLVGSPKAIEAGRELGELLELSPADAEAAAGLVGASSFDLLVLDGSLPAASLAALLGALPAADRPERPAVLLVSGDGRRGELGGLLLGHADDVVNGSLGAGELLSRARGALRVRGFLSELHRKNSELSAVYERVDSMARRMAEELRLASIVQRSLMPPPLAYPHLDVAREFIPFREIGGDYYDLVALGPSRLAFAIGDVMGKGVPAALLAANLRACLRAQLQGPETVPAELVAGVNRLFSEVAGASTRGLFASLFFGVFDFEHGRLDYVNAGHDHPFRVAPDAGIVELSVGGTVLGLQASTRYETGTVAIERDDVLVFYSDGVTDRGNGRGELYGVERLKETARRSRGDASRIALYTLLGEIQGWSGGAAAEDDMTLIVTKVR